VARSSPAPHCRRVVYVGSSDHVFRAIDMGRCELIWSNDGIGDLWRPSLSSPGPCHFRRLGRTPLRPQRGDGPARLDVAGEKESPFYSPAACWPVAGNGKVFVVARIPG